VTLPEVKFVMKEHNPTSAIGTVEFPTRLDKMALSLKGDWDPSFVAASADGFHVQLFQIRGNYVSEDAQGRSMEQSVVAHIRARSAGHKPGASKSEDPTEVDYNWSVEAYKLELDGVPIFDIDLRTGKHEVLGKNLNSTRSENLGL